MKRRSRFGEITGHDDVKYAAATKMDLVRRCKEGLEKGGCSLPFPQRDVHLFQQAGKD